LRDVYSVRGSSNRDSSFKNNVLTNTKKSSEKVQVSDRTNKRPDVAARNVILNKKIVTDVDVKNALKVKDALCVSYAKVLKELLLFKSMLEIECRTPRNQGNRSADNERRVVPVETPINDLVVQDGLDGYEWNYQAEEGPTDFALMAHSSDIANSSNSEV
nr:hypothetical protein [Tanacetum cinerariifolium]